MGRTLARSQALQLLYQAELTGRSVEGVLSGPFVVALDDQEVAPAELDEYARELALGCDGLRPQLDALIADLSRNWALTRMPSVDRNLLRLAIFEMLCVEEVAVAVTIDESVELAKAFGTDESSRFVNGLLGRVADQIDAGIDVLAEAARMASELEAKAQEAEEEADSDDASAGEATDVAADADTADEGVADAGVRKDEPTAEAPAEPLSQEDSGEPGVEPAADEAPAEGDL